MHWHQSESEMHDPFAFYLSALLHQNRPVVSIERLLQTSHHPLSEWASTGRGSGPGQERLASWCGVFGLIAVLRTASSSDRDGSCRPGPRPASRRRSGRVEWPIQRRPSQPDSSPIAGSPSRSVEADGLAGFRSPPLAIEFDWQGPDAASRQQIQSMRVKLPGEVQEITLQSDVVAWVRESDLVRSQFAQSSTRLSTLAMRWN